MEEEEDFGIDNVQIENFIEKSGDNISKTLWECFQLMKQEVQGLQAFSFPIETVYDEHAKSRFKRKLRGQI